jgi:hypothetical protein
LVFFNEVIVVIVRVVILGVQRLTGGLVHYIGREPGVLDIFSEYSLKIPQIYSNMLEYTQIYLIISLSGGRGGLLGEAGGRTDNPGYSGR